MASERDCVDQLVAHAKATGARRRLQLTETVTLGLLTSLKWDVARSGKPPGYVPTPDDLSKADHFTDRQLADMRETALDLLAQHAERSVSWRVWWSGVWQNMVGSLFWAIFLFVMGLLALRFTGGDAGAILRDLIRERPATQAGDPPAK